MADLLLAVDIGSTWCKAAYLDHQGRVAAAGRAPTRQIPAGRVETLHGFWDAFVAAIRDAGDHLSGEVRPAAIGIACRALFGVCLDRAGQASWPSWQSSFDRSSPHVQEAFSSDVWRGSNPFRFGYATSFAGLMRWLRHNLPDEWRNLHRVGALHDYILYRMTGEWVTDPATGPGQYAWPDEILALTGLAADQLPTILDPHQVAGGLLPEASIALGLPCGTPVVVGQHDGAAANLGVGAVQVGDGCFTFGTNFVFRPVTGRRLPSHSMGYPVAPDTWAWVGNIPGASLQMEMVTQMLLDNGAGVQESHGHLSALGAQVAPGSDGLVLSLVPPGEEESLRHAVHAALDSGHPAEVVYRAVLEAVALGERNLVARSRRDGAEPTRFVATGGGARNQLFMQILAGFLDAPVEMGEADGGLLGAGMSAAIGAGWYATVEQAVAGMRKPGLVVQPNWSAVERYR